MKKDDNIFIDHIKNHLERDQEVICKICGKTVKNIIKEYKVKIGIENSKPTKNQGVLEGNKT